MPRGSDSAGTELLVGGKQRRLLECCLPVADPTARIEPGTFRLRGESLICLLLTL